MGRSLEPAELLPGGRVLHQSSGSVITIEQQNGHLVHTLAERGLSATYPVAYQIGRGIKGRTYLVAVDDYLLESPASWYRDTGWDVSPGYESMQLIDFDRPISLECLFCHAGKTKFADADARRLANQPTAITCERCHGPAEDHLRRPSANNIINPARLVGAARDSICEQCHLEGETRVLNSGKTLQDFRPGEDLEQTVVTYLLNNGNAGQSVTQAEELAESKCAQSSAGKLWCGTCHHPHGEAADRNRQIRTVCLSCHGTLSKAAHPGGQQPQCITCHMPARPSTNIAHVAATDHRIHRPGTAQASQSGADRVRTWRDPAPDLRRRDLAMGQLQIAIERNLQSLAKEAFEVLRTLPPDQLGKDADALSTLEIITMARDPERAIPLGRRIVELKPQSASCALNLGLALKQSGNSMEAEQQLRRAIDLDPSLMEAYAQLAKLYDEQKRTGDAAETIERFLKWNPRNIQFRLAHSQ